MNRPNIKHRITRIIGYLSICFIFIACIQAIEECGITADDFWFSSKAVHKTCTTIIYNTFNQ